MREFFLSNGRCLGLQFLVYLSQKLFNFLYIIFFNVPKLICQSRIRHRNTQMGDVEESFAKEKEELTMTLVKVKF